MAFTPTSTSFPSPSTAALVADDTFQGFEPEVNLITLAITQAQEQLHQAMEVKEVEELRWWMEKRWEEQMLEWDSIVRLGDKELAIEAADHVVVEIWKKWYIVSVGFSLS